MNVNDIFSEMVERGMPLNSILREADYKLSTAQRAELQALLISNTLEPYVDSNGATYREVILPNEVRLEFLGGIPGVDIPHLGGVAVNTVDFTFEHRRRNWLKTYQFRKGSIRYKFDERLMTEVAPDMFVVSSLLDNGNTIAIGRFDGKPGFIIISQTGCDTLGVEYAIKKEFKYSVVGHYKDRLILHYANL